MQQLTHGGDVGVGGGGAAFLDEGAGPDAL